MAPSHLAVYSLVGLVVFAVAFKLFVIDYMFPDASLHIIQDPLLLAPSLLLALVITGVRYLIYAAFKKKGHSFAEKQIDLAKPKWTQTKNTRKDNENGVNANNSNTHTNANDNTTRKRNTSEGQPNNITQNGIVNKNDTKLTQLTENQSQTLLNIASNKDTTKEDLLKLCNELSLTTVQINDIRSYRKTSLEYDSHVNKFLEVHFKLIMTVTIMLYGINVVALRDSAFWHSPSLYTGVNDKPPQDYDGMMLFYYWLSLGYHVHRCVFQFFNHARSDFWAMFIHHWSTIALIMLSWVSGFCETGCLVMFLHDNGDVWLPLAKLFRYNGWMRAKDVCFIVFTVTWVQFRMYWFFKLVIYTTWIHGRVTYIYNHPWGFICFILLLVLQTLHVYWFILIMTIVKNLVLFGSKGVEDIRSDAPPDAKIKCKNKFEKQH